MLFFVDTNIIIDYIKRRDPKLTDFINEHSCFYTETVLAELGGNTDLVPPVFKYVCSNINPVRKNDAYIDIAGKTCLTQKQEVRFKNDIFIILESGYMCADVIQKFGDPMPKLLTNNLKLYKKFLQTRGESILEDCINKHGLEHLIEVVRLPDLNL